MDLLPYRLVLHQCADQKDHLDLFLLPLEQNFLYTYEIHKTFQKIFEKRRQEKHFVELCQTTNRAPNQAVWQAIPKSHHRLHYWSYSGRLSKGRGEIQELGRGDFFLIVPVILLSLIPSRWNSV